MDFSSPHLPFVLSSYGLTLVVLLILIGWHIVKARATAKRLDSFEKDGAERRPPAKQTP